MRAVLQRVERASVAVGGEVKGAIRAGLLVLLGAEEGDGDADVRALAAKIPVLRIFDDQEGRMNRSLLDVGGAVLLVSQFTLLADTRGGRRPAYVRAMRPALAEAMVAEVGRQLRAQHVQVAEGVFGAHMQVDLVNDGPVTIVLDTRREL
jgi:D-tyrosyl-tRNA(Tyr) deacylase